MEKIQFKRAETAAGLESLDAGEIGVIVGRNAKERGIVIGTEYGNQLIRQNPFYSNRVVTGITLDNAGTTPKLTITQHTFDGVESTYELDFVIRGTIDTAKKLSSNAGSDTASKCQPIYFSGGKPTNIIQTRGSATTPVWLHEGKIEPITSYSGECTGKVSGTILTDNTVNIGKSFSVKRFTDIQIPVTTDGIDFMDQRYGMNTFFDNMAYHSCCIQFSTGVDSTKISAVLYVHKSLTNWQYSSVAAGNRWLAIHKENGKLMLYIYQNSSPVAGTIYSIQQIG